MQAERWRRIKELVAAVLEQPPGHRDAWLHEACGGSPELMADVRTLIEAAAVTHGFLERPAAAASGDAAGRERRFEPGTRVGHYELIAWVGAGGMGDVYRARDLALGRDAALKLLPANVDSALRRRLLHEAEASARLQHPAIATFYEAGEADGETFIAMEFVDGLTLRARLADGPLPVAEALTIARCLLEALAHAHAAGLLHRDIKPENIILTGPHAAKLLDFSIATPLRSATDRPTAWTHASGATLTGSGRLVGTVGYLAPEQALGEHLDARTDLFQVGAVLYEALTGRPAFAGTSLIERLAALMTGEPDLWTVTAEGAPAALVEILRKALARHPADRYATAAAFLRDIHDLAGGRIEPAQPRMLAVVDFDNRTGDADLSWLGTALAESLRTDLARLQHVVMPRDKLRAGAAAAGPDRPDALALCLRLGCSWAVTGHLERAGSALRIAAHLVDVATGHVVRRAEAAGMLSELFSLQDSIARTIASALSEAGATMARRRRDTDLEVYECYTRASVLVNDFGKGSLEEARVLLERAIAIDDRHVESLAALTTTYGLRAIANPNTADYEAAVACAERALAIDPNHVRAQVWRGYALAGLGRTVEAGAAFARALELDPTDSDALYFAAAHALLYVPRPQAAAAVALLQRAVEAEASFGMWWLALGTAHRCLDHLPEALYSFGRARKLEGTAARFTTAGAAAYSAETLRRQRRLDDARVEALAGIEAAERSDHAYRDTFRAHALTVLGRVALDHGDVAAADAAFRQVLAQARGRPRPRACGHFVVQALCGLARATGTAQPFLEARTLFEVRDRYNFGRFYGALDDDTMRELAQTGQLFGEAR